jgi:hypothetical protein
MQVPPQLICVPGHETVHTPLAHTLPAAQAVPALPLPPAPHAPVAPHCVRLVCGSMQVPPQLICVPGQDTLHTPLAHTLPSAQAVPALPPLAPQPGVAPQKARLLLGSTQVPPHSTRLAWHETAHVPLEHRSPGVHSTPQVPQLRRSVLRLEQNATPLASPPVGPGHNVSPPPQVVLQTPLLQARPGPQTLPQAPQLLLSV